METGQLKNKRVRSRSQKKDISIMTLLANDSTDAARKLLIKYGIDDATGYDDLEWKLTQLYFKPETNKAKLEEEMAEIHPHKNWLLKVLKKDIQAPKTMDLKTSSADASIEQAHQSIRKVVDEASSNCQGNPACKCNQSSACGSCGNSSLDAEPEPRGFKVQNTPIGIMGIIVVTGLTFYFLSKTIKTQ